jgi:DNA-binding FadR family transcriptional regulator
MRTVMELHTELYEACAGGDVNAFQNALTRHYVETERTVREGFRAIQADRAEAVK